jgi:DNA-binding NtrC family response regulator
MKLIVGQSAAIRQIDHSVSALATSERTVCVYGEGGTGKTLIAQAIHARDPHRAGRPLVVLHCATLRTDSRNGNKIVDLFEGASQVARGGTVVLKEVAALSPSSQTGILHVINRQGAVHTRVRVVATTTRVLLSSMQQEQLHADLFRHLTGITITVPPLRKRKADIPWLAAHFIHCFSVRYCREIRGMTPLALRVLLKHDWPGNVRELQCCIDRACRQTHRALIDCAEVVATIDARKA